MIRAQNNCNQIQKDGCLSVSLLTLFFLDPCGLLGMCSSTAIHLYEYHLHELLRALRKEKKCTQLSTCKNEWSAQSLGNKKKTTPCQSKAALKFISPSNPGICLADLNYSSLETIQPRSWGNIMTAMLNSTALLKAEKLYPWLRWKPYILLDCWCGSARRDGQAQQHVLPSLQHLNGN